MTRRGFTLIEMLMVVIVLGILAGLALPKVRESRRRAEAAAVVGDLSTLRVAALGYFGDANLYPATAAAGVVPTEFVKYLPKNFDFKSKNSTTYRWMRWGTAAGGVVGKAAASSAIIGVTVTSTDQPFLAQIAAVTQGTMTVSGTTLTWVIY